MNDAAEFRKLIAASFVSQTGSHFLTLALAAFVLLSTGSAVQSALVFVLSYLPSILAAPRLGHWVDCHVSKRLIATNELISIASTVLCGLCIEFRLPMAALCAVLALRSILLFVGRAAGTKWLKLITSPALQTGRIKLFYLAFFLSTAVSGLLAALVLKHASIRMVVGIDVASYLLGIALYMTLAAPPTEPAGQAPAPEGEALQSLRETLDAIFAIPVVRTSFLAVCLSQAVFQGAYSAFVSYLPISVFKVGVGGVGSFQLAASIGIIGGFLINWLAAGILAEIDPQVPRKALWISGLAAAFLICAVSIPAVRVSLGSFLLLNLAYECVWLHHNSEFFRASPKRHAARYQFILSSCAAFLMSAMTLAYSAAVQWLGPSSGTLSVLMGGVLVTAYAGMAPSWRQGS
ncbi:MAG: MFS transporter [Elusimicrobia bacterium]|nr:MFS transporter [Elusimicrobiota bacterium]